MKKGRETINRIQINKFIFIITLLFFLAMAAQLARVALSTEVDGVNLKQFASNRNTKKEILYANRGTIYTSKGDVLAQNVDSYTVIAYLSPKRSVNSKTPMHVVDKQMTAETLAPILNMSVADLLKLLSKENLYQVELRPGGVGITEIKKEAIEALKLPGIDFIQTFKRYYPNDNFLSYTLGYVQTSDDNKMTGEMGLEKYYNKELSGEDGKLEYQKDLNGYKIPNTPEIREDQKDGMDIYLTIDDNIQMFTERVIKETKEKYNPEWMIITVMDAKTGKILSMGSNPSFNPNVKDITNYLNPLVSYTYEPGSTMKTFTYMAAMEKGTYNGAATFKSGSLTFGESTISDWNNKGWGTITYDQGYALSSNVGAASMIDNFINREDLKAYLAKLGFGKKTGFTLPNEANGEINFKYKVEVANAAFGQGITITPIQMLQALTPIANDGVMIKPYIIDKIYDPNTKKVVFEGAREEVAKVASPSTTNKMKDLMYNVINGDTSVSTGYPFKIEGYDIIGKTGTAQYVDPTTGKYCTGKEDYIRSFTGLFPKDDPQVIIYGVMKKAAYGASAGLSIATKKLINDIAKYLNIKQNINNPAESISTFTVPNYINKNISTINTNNHKTIIIGDGTKVVAQYPKENVPISSNDKIFILTNGKNIKLENMYGWSSREANIYCNLINIKCNIQGTGFVNSQSVAAGTNLNGIAEINLDLKGNN